MAPGVTAIERLEERPIGVDPAAIEGEFDRIWHETTASGYDESSVRLRVLNFVAIGYGEDDGDRFDAVMPVLSLPHPGRGILAVMDDKAPALDARISAHCIRSPRGGLHVCSEEVVLTGGRRQQQELASAVLALLVPEIPVAVWLMAHEDAGGYLATEVLDAADIVLIDSDRAAEKVATCSLELRLSRELEIPVHDLAWGRIEAWRALSAQFFDSPEGMAELNRIEAITIRGGGGVSSSEAMLLAGWLVSRLGFALADAEVIDSELRATLYDGTRGVRLSVLPGKAAGGHVEEFVIRTRGAEFVLQAHIESGHMHIIERWEDGESRRMVEQPPLDDASVIVAALDGEPSLTVSRDAIAAVVALLGG